MVLRGATSLLGALEGVGPENRDFFGPWNGTSEVSAIWAQKSGMYLLYRESRKTERKRRREPLALCQLTGERKERAQIRRQQNNSGPLPIQHTVFSLLPNTVMSCVRKLLLLYGPGYRRRKPKRMEKGTGHAVFLLPIWEVTVFIYFYYTVLQGTQRKQDRFLHMYTLICTHPTHTLYSA